MTRRMLPRYVSQFTDNRGKIRYRFRRTGQPTHYFKAPLGSQEFMAEYQGCLEIFAFYAKKGPERQTIPGALSGSKAGAAYHTPRKGAAYSTPTDTPPETSD